ncbi:MAG TPA: transporter substrate-binding domain-containing protein [Dongiaceae bacterium]|nr:transporter substrate-binding domain-containing protein [Dongiaceae bacterium]
MRRVLTALILLIVPTWLTSAQATCNRKIVWAWNDFPPYAYRAPSGELKGLDVEIVQRVLQVAGCQSQAVELPPKRALALVERGQIDLVAAASITPERQRYGYFSDSYRDERTIVFMRADNAQRGTLKSAGDLYAIRPRLVASLGGFYGNVFMAYEQATAPDGLVSRNPDIEDRFRMTALGRVDGVVEDDVAGADVARRLGFQDQLAPTALVLNQAPIYFLMSQISVTEGDVAEINRAIGELRSSGELARIIDSYRLSGN